LYPDSFDELVHEFGLVSSPGYPAFPRIPVIGVDRLFEIDDEPAPVDVDFEEKGYFSAFLDFCFANIE
jgi:hypothetical protein